MGKMIQGVTLTPLKIISGELGSVMHALKKSEDTFASFGEVYFSLIKEGARKGWKKHREMVLNIVVPHGKIRFIIYDDRADSFSYQQYSILALSPTQNYQRLTIQPGLWVAFEGLFKGESMLLNISSIEHDPSEAETCSIDSDIIKYPTFANE